MVFSNLGRSAIQDNNLPAVATRRPVNSVLEQSAIQQQIHAVPHPVNSQVLHKYVDQQSINSATIPNIALELLDHVLKILINLMDNPVEVMVWNVQMDTVRARMNSARLWDPVWESHRLALRLSRTVKSLVRVRVVAYPASSWTDRTSYRVLPVDTAGVGTSSSRPSRSVFRLSD